MDGEAHKCAKCGNFKEGRAQGEVSNRVTGLTFLVCGDCIQSIMNATFPEKMAEIAAKKEAEVKGTESPANE